MIVNELDKRFSFWYPVITMTQLGLFGEIQKEIDVLKKGHIVVVRTGNLLCKDDKAKIMKRERAVKERKADRRIENTELCPICQIEYKKRLRIFQKNPRKVAAVVYDSPRPGG